MGRSILLCYFAFFLASAGRPSPTPEEILAGAQRYTVKIQVQNEIAFNQDNAGSGSGTGFLVDLKRGWLLTNAHVATRSPSIVKVSFKGGEPIVAERIHVDPLIDLAVLAIPPSSIPDTATEAPLACESAPVAGTSVMAFGHPWGMSYTASRGIVSGLAWFYPSLMIQTDAAINSGNSGGPLISLVDGHVIGINTSTYQPDEGEGSTAISLAEPLPSVCRILELLKAGADTRLRVLPLATAIYGDDLRPRVAQLYQPTLGFQLGDIITKVNGGREIKSLPDLLNDLRGTSEDVSVTVDRKGASVNVVSPVRILADPLKVRSINLSGLVISEPWRIDDLEVNPKRYLFVDWYESGEEAALTDVRLDDHIVSVDGREFRTVDALYSYLAKLPEDAEVELVLVRSTSAAEFYREYSRITLSRKKLEWIAVE